MVSVADPVPTFRGPSEKQELNPNRKEAIQPARKESNPRRKEALLPASKESHPGLQKEAPLPVVGNHLFDDKGIVAKDLKSCL
jgi:hypothetical protein